MKGYFKYVLAALVLLVMPSFVLAKQYASKTVIHPAGETIDGNYYAAGEQVLVSGDVAGDLIVAGGVVQVDGVVSGDIIAAGGQVRLSGPVQGDIRVAGGDVYIDSVVGKNATVAGGNVFMSSDAAIGWELLVMAGNIDMNATVERNLLALAGALKLNGQVKGDVEAKVGEPNQFIIQNQARIGGDLVYKSPTQANVLSGSEIGGMVDFKAMRQKDAPKQKSVIIAVLSALYAGVILFSLVSLWILGLLFVWLIPKHAAKVKKQLQKDFWPSFARGFIGLLVAPIIIVMLLMTGIGILPAILLAMAVFAGSICAILHVSLLMGDAILTKLSGRKWRGVSPYWAMLLGVLVFVILSALPFIGWLLKLFLISVGFGGWLHAVHAEVKRMR